MKVKFILSRNANTLENEINSFLENIESEDQFYVKDIKHSTSIDDYSYFYTVMVILIPKGGEQNDRSK